MSHCAILRPNTLEPEAGSAPGPEEDIHDTR